jgi:hypothetical protein
MDRQTRNTLIAAAIVLACAAAYWHFVYISAAEATAYRRVCEDWISEEFNSGRPATAGKPWKKHGKIVFQVLAARDEGTVKDGFLCVVDPVAETLLKPSMLDQSWR